jgi:hypothetical protein
VFGAGEVEVGGVGDELADALRVAAIAPPSLQPTIAAFSSLSSFITAMTSSASSW